MLLYILRHADADTEAATDDDRPLSEKGRQQAEKVAVFCKTHEIRPALVLTSPLPRAHQTAEPVATKTKAELRVAPWLACGMMPVTAIDELKEHRGRPSVMLVGHEPDLSALIAYLVGLNSNSLLYVRKGSLTALELDAPRPGAARLEFSIPCKMM